MWRGIGQRLRSLQEMDQRINTTKNFVAPGAIKLTQHHPKGSLQLMFMLFYFSVVKIPLGLVTFR